jgi:phage-related protein
LTDAELIKTVEAQKALMIAVATGGPRIQEVNGRVRSAPRRDRSSRRDLKAFPRDVQREIGQALFAAQCGEEYPSVKALKGFGDRTVLEIVASFKSDAYRAVYTVRFVRRRVRAPRVSEEVEKGDCDAVTGD